MDYETGKTFEQIRTELDLLWKILDEKGLVPKEYKKEEKA